MIAAVGLMLSEIPPSAHSTDVSTPTSDLDLDLQGGHSLADGFSRSAGAGSIDFTRLSFPDRRPVEENNGQTSRTP